jgi:Rrf2 family protein
MLRINHRTDYAIRVMLSLARREPGARLATQVVQEEMQIPRPFLRRIIADLSHVGLVNTFAGPNGGLELARPAKTIHLRHIWEAIEGPISISECLSGSNACPLKAGCLVKGHWCRLQSLIIQELESTRLDQLAQEAGRLAEGQSVQTAPSGIFAPLASR